jgi:hypothetical protein
MQWFALRLLEILFQKDPLMGEQGMFPGVFQRGNFKGSSTTREWC